MNKGLYHYEVFFTVMEGDKFISSNVCCGITNSIKDAVRFEYLDDVRRFYKNLNKEKEFKIVRVKCILEEVGD